ncbi:unnamed protein product [Ascophyllum nodosum]
MSAATLPEMATATGIPSVAKEGVVIVGGGPSGLATALMLAKRGWRDISVIERTPSADFFDKELAFVYQIDRRGQNFLDCHGLTEKLAAISVDTREFTVTQIPASGERKEVSLPIIDDSRPTGYWLPRNVFQKLLYSEVEAAYPEQIKVLYSSTCKGIERVAGGSGIEVRARLHGQGKDIGKETVFRPRLLVGADGLKSTVRQRLGSWDDEAGAAGKVTGDRGGGKARQKGRFEMRKQPSGSSGLRYKVLALPSGFRLGKNDDERAKSHKAYAISSRFKDAKRTLRIGVLPWGPPGSDREEASRGGNFITLPGHPLWDIKTAKELKSFLADAFPQIVATESIEDAELARFAESKGGCFPDPQYCPGLQWVVGKDEGVDEVKGLESPGGVVLVGDAIHAFPPDLGQGVNSALEDVLVLERALDKCGDRVEEALPEYERMRTADSKALIRLCQIGFPWQYRQPVFLGPKLWTANFLLRTMFLNKFFPKVFGEQAFMLVQKNYDASYSEILEKANRTTRRIWLTATAMGLAIIFRPPVVTAARSLVTRAISLLSGAL